MLKAIMTKLGFNVPSIDNALIVVAQKELRTLTQDRDNFVEIVHEDGYKSRHRILLTHCAGGQFVYKRDRADYWDHLKDIVANKLPGELNRVCIAGHLYRL